MEKVIITNNTAIIVVDMQNDFCPGGSLPVPEGDVIIPLINRYTARFRDMGLPVYFTRDWHPPNHISFKISGGIWPEHCVQNTHGAELHPEILIPDGAFIIDKGTASDKEAYSGFQGTALEECLKEGNIRRLFVGGLATDYCVRNTVLDALASGFEVVFLSDASKGVDVKPGDSARAVDDMLKAGAVKAVYDDVIW